MLDRDTKKAPAICKALVILSTLPAETPTSMLIHS